ncbi:helix-turn-helix domain-containing protein [Dermacoccus nishinomiyaensis]|uniref:helix-turn-helix domain-containing protein n=1 Tax=Dermacoccus nishinomiyaensis TaxID=1274 RepID=UPI0021148729|nr:helix-turn-helix transcriptional regulator [Dermacoccus nishinomiyaensis]
MWRESLGDVLRQERVGRGERLSDVAERAGLSAQYLSEIERGLKDPSSEMLHAIAGALELEVPDVARRAASVLEATLATPVMGACQFVCVSGVFTGRG